MKKLRKTFALLLAMSLVYVGGGVFFSCSSDSGDDDSPASPSKPVDDKSGPSVQPVNPDEPSTPENPDNPQNPDNPETPENPQNPDNPEKAVTGVELNKSELELNRWAEETLTAIVSPEDATDKSVSWSSSDESVVKVVDGKITALAAGSASVTVKTNDGEKTASASVTVNPVYVSAGKYNLSTASVEGFSVDGTSGGNWASFGSVDGSGFQVHDNILITSKIDSNGANLYSDAKKGIMSFSLERAMKVTFAGKNGSFAQTGKIQTENGAIISKKAENATVAENGLSATIGDDVSKSAILYLDAGDYTVIGNASSSFKLQTIVFEEAKLTPDPNSGLSVETGWMTEEIKLEIDSENPHKINLLLPEGVELADDEIEWLMFGELTNVKGKSFVLDDSVKVYGGDNLSSDWSGFEPGKSYMIQADFEIDGILYASSPITIIYQ